jgi:hypothetical protein
LEWFEGDSGGQDVAAVVGDQHVLFEAHAAEAVQLAGALSSRRRRGRVRG